MKMFEALSMLMAARDGQIPNKKEAVNQYGEKSKRTLRTIGMKEKELNSQYPDKQLQYGLFLVCNHPIVFSEQCKAAAAWLLNRN